MRRLLLVVLVVVATWAVGCDGPRETQTVLFERAEAFYRDGDYDAALDGYQAFLAAYPDSPLSETAELRIRCIHREVRSVLMRKDMPRPRYTGKKEPAEADKAARKASGNVADGAAGPAEAADEPPEMIDAPSPRQ